MRALEKDPSDRFSDAAIMAEALVKTQPVVSMVTSAPNILFKATTLTVPYQKSTAVDTESPQVIAPVPDNSLVQTSSTRHSLASEFQSLITEKTKDFVGREYVFTAIDDFLNSQPSGYFIIEGDPGVGKSAILAEYVRRTGCVAHFNVRAQGITHASQFLESVCKQLIARYNLPYPSLPTNATRNGAFLARVLAEVNDQFSEDELLVVGLDALDEVDMSGHTPGSNILYLPPSLPDNIYFILTRRHITVPLVIQSPQHLLDLVQYYDESLQDVKIYVQQAVEQPQLRAWIDAQELTIDNFISILAEKSENNFMYLRYVLPDIERGVYKDLSIDRLPVGLAGYYEDHWQRMGMTTKPLPRVKIKIVYILAEIRQPVSRGLIAEFSDEDQFTVQEVLDEWEQFLRKQPAEGETHYSVYHTSFRDFLYRKDIVQAAGVTIKDINAMIADNLWQELFGNE